MFERIKQMLIKEFLQIFRDPRMRSILFIVPIFQSLIFGYAVTTDVKNVSTAIIDKDNSVKSREVITAFVESEYFSLDYYVDKMSEAQDLLDKGDVLIVLNIEDGFQKKIEAGQRAPLQVIIDGTDGNSARIISHYVSNIIENKSKEFLLKKTFNHKNDSQLAGIDLESRAWFNENLESRNFYIPGILSTILTLVTLTMTSMSIVREKEVGTIEQILVTPMRKFEFILGKTVPFTLIAYFDVIAIILVATFWFEVPLRGSLLLLFTTVSFYLLTILGIGFFISTISYTQQQAMMATFFFYFPMVLLSGFLFPIANMPEIIQWITYLNPLRYFIVFIRALFLKGVGIEILWPEILTLAMMGIFTIWQATKRFQKTLS